MQFFSETDGSHIRCACFKVSCSMQSMGQFQKTRLNVKEIKSNAPHVFQVVSSIGLLNLLKFTVCSKRSVIPAVIDVLILVTTKLLLLTHLPWSHGIGISQSHSVGYLSVG